MKVVKLSENDIKRIVNKVLSESLEDINESVNIGGTDVNAKNGKLNINKGDIVNNYHITVSCSKFGITAYSGPVSIVSLWKGKDGGIAGKDNTGKVFSIPVSKSTDLTNKMVRGDKVINTEGEGTIGGISGKCSVVLKKI